MAAICPECEYPIMADLDEIEEGETLQCEECGVELEVVSVDPFEVSVVDEAGYDDEDSPYRNVKDRDR
ncbi:MAG: hypothetical protein FWD64_10800 [Acidobacteriaceae bacterium]|nr:hypothetical protein [Acidobacteriaceae bacterium]